MSQIIIICVIFLALALLLQPTDALYDVARYCQLVPIGSKLPSIESCQIYYTCNVNDYSTHSCDLNESFDKDKQSCQPSSWVKCLYNLRNPCSQSDKGFLPNPLNCKEYVSCINGKEIGRGLCPKGQVFDGLQQSCVYGACENNVELNPNGDLDNVCEVMQVNKFFGDLKKCKTWKICTSEGQLVQGMCRDGLVYDALSRMCLRDDGQMCTRLQTPVYGCDSNNKAARQGDHYICSDYYECDGRDWHKHACPIGYYFDTLLNNCMQRHWATPVASCNRCQYASGKWVNAVDPQCSHYYECSSDGRMIREGVCNAGAYFHEARQVCIMDPTDLSDYRGRNGACYKKNSSPDNEYITSDATTIGIDGQTTTSISSQVTTSIPPINSPSDRPTSTIAPPTSSESAIQYSTTTSQETVSQSSTTFPTTAEATTTTISTDLSDSTSPVTTSQISTTSLPTNTPTTSSPTSSTQETCKPTEKGLYKSDPLICSIFYICNGNFWIKHHCQLQQFFDIQHQQCLDRTAATPIAGCDRCQYATTVWVSDIDPECSKYLICRNGSRVSQSTCCSKSYFDEKRQACVVGALSLEKYRQKNGACRKVV